MIHMIRSFYLFILFICFLVSCKNETSKEFSPADKQTLFKRVDSDYSNIHFRNDIKETPNLNGILYEYLYNGGGVAAGDLNGDQKTDLYFVSNLATNLLYINQGDLKFSRSFCNFISKK